MLSEMNHIRNNKTAEIVEEYISSLQELNTNSKPHINMLTLLAEDYIEYASAIVEAVEAHIQKVQSEVKLPVLYLIDSIIKNVNGLYLTLFTKNIVHTFCDVFEKVDENTRVKMWKLRQTWNEVFSAKELFSLDVQVHNIDPAWPLSALPPNVTPSKSIIHVNPKFLSMQQKTQQQITLTPMNDSVSVTEQQMNQEFVKKQQELIKLQKLKPQLEILLQKQRQFGRSQIHVKPELIASNGLLKQPIINSVPCDDLRLLDNQSLIPDNELLNSNESASNLQPVNSVLKSDSEIENGIYNNGIIVEDNKTRMSMCLESGIDSSLVSSSRVCASDEVPRSDSCQSDANTDLSLIFNDNKCFDNDRNQRSSSSSQKIVTAVTVDAQQKNSSERLSSKGSSARASSFSCLSLKQQQLNSSSLNSPCSRNRSWTKPQDDNSLTSNAIASSISSSPSSYSSPHKKLSKSYQRNRSPGGYQHHQHYHPYRQSLELQQSCFDEKERFDSLNRTRSPENERQNDSVRQRRDSSSSKDEDLRTALIAASNAATTVVAAAALDSKEDLDLRILPMSTSKRQSSELRQSSDSKKKKNESFDDLFGKEDVDLRLLNPTTQSAVTQVLPPLIPPLIPSLVISSDKDGWAKLKTPMKSDSIRSETNHLSDGRISVRGRTKLYNKISDERRRGARDYDRNPDRNIEIIMKQAAEQLNQGTITKSQYNKLIQEVLHMSEDQKLRAAQRKERESKMWERNDKGMRPKELGMHPRPPGGPRWQPWHQPWAHPPGPFQSHFRHDFRPIGPWQNHPRLFGGPMRSDFHQFHAGFNPRLTHPSLAPNGPLIIPNGSLKSLSGSPLISLGGALSPVSSNLILGASNSIIAKNLSPSSGDGTTDIPVWSIPSYGTNEVKSIDEPEVSSSNSDDLPPADLNLVEEILKDTMKSINIDNVSREIRYYGHTGIIFMHWDDPRDIGFQHGARRISIDGQDTIVCSFNDDYREFTYDGEVHRIKLGAPTRELYVDDKWYQCYFGGQPVTVDLGSKKIALKLDGPPPQVKIGTIKRTDLVLGKINLIINARSMVPVFLDAKPQVFSIEGNSCTLEFIDSLQTVLINGQPLEVEFGGLPKPVFVQGKKHFIRFSVLPRSFRAGYVKITGMKGEQPKEGSPDNIKQQIMSEVSSSTSIILPLPSPIEPDSTSQDGMDHSYTSKSDLQLDVLSSVVTSAMAPPSGLSYQAEPLENPPASASNITLPLNLSELFQRLLDTGIVSNLNETKKPEEEKKVPEIIPVSFEKPETLKIKQPAMVKALYSGIQCSSCGERFAPEMATRYSHHLDWHFRQNRKERDSSRKVHSRIWYYDISDWIQFEEIEDLEDRAQSWFETEKQNMEIETAAAEELFAETLQPSIPTGSEEDSCCQVCHEPFEQFYNDEKEEWHLKPAICFENKNFHPLCLEDHKKIVNEPFAVGVSDPNNQNKMSASVKDEKQEIKHDIEIEKEKDSESIKKEEPHELMKGTENTSADTLETIDKKICEIPLDESTEQSSLEVKKEDTNKKVSQNEIIEKIIDINENSSENAITNIEMKNESILIKEEPIELQSESEINTPETVKVDLIQVEVKSIIDENVEVESNTSINLSQSNIKIDTTKSLESSKEPKEIISENEAKNEDKLEEQKFSEVLKSKSMKPALCDRNLSILPPVEKGEELSALCSIM